MGNNLPTPSDPFFDFDHRLHVNGKPRHETIAPYFFFFSIRVPLFEIFKLFKGRHLLAFSFDSSIFLLYFSSSLQPAHSLSLIINPLVRTRRLPWQNVVLFRCIQINLPVIEQKKGEKGKRRKYPLSLPFWKKGIHILLPWKMCWPRGSSLISCFVFLLLFLYQHTLICLSFFWIDRPTTSTLYLNIYIHVWLVMQNWFVSVHSSPRNFFSFYSVFLSVISLLCPRFSSRKSVKTNSSVVC